MKHKIPKIGNINLKHKGGKPRMKRTIVLLALMAVLVTGTVMAALSIDEPDTNDYVNTATYIINGTPWAGDDNIDGNCTNITLDYRVSGGSTYTYIGANTSVTNITANWRVLFDTMALKDDTTYSLRARCINDSNSVVLETGTEVTFKVDNTAPVCTHSQSSRETYNPKQTWTVTGTNSSSATIKFGGNDQEEMIETGSSEVYTWTGHLPESTYEPVRTVTSDGYNTTTCDLNFVRIDARSTIKQVGVAIAAQEGQKAAGGTNTIAIVIIAGLLIWYYYKKK